MNSPLSPFSSLILSYSLRLPDSSNLGIGFAPPKVYPPFVRIITWAVENGPTG